MNAASAASPTAHLCPSCGRRFVVVAGGNIASPPRCVCGAELVARELTSGIYQIRRSRRASRRRPPRPSAVRVPPAREPDHGYGESHGYGPAHGGPSGPGDAPADEDASPTSEA